MVQGVFHTYAIRLQMEDPACEFSNRSLPRLQRGMGYTIRPRRARPSLPLCWGGGRGSVLAVRSGRHSQSGSVCVDGDGNAQHHSNLFRCNTDRHIGSCWILRRVWNRTLLAFRESVFQVCDGSKQRWIRERSDSRLADGRRNCRCRDRSRR